MGTTIFNPSGQQIVQSSGVPTNIFALWMQWVVAGLTASATGAGLTAGQLLVGAGGNAITVGNLSGDVTTSGSTVTTLATVNASPGTFGDSTHVAQVTVNAKGLSTLVANVAIDINALLDGLGT